MKKQKILSLLLALAMIFSIIPTGAFAQDPQPAADAKVWLTVSNKGLLEKASDGSVMANREVTVKDLNSDGFLSFDEALKAAHLAYNSESGYTVDGYVKKLWGTVTSNTLFFTNNVGLLTGGTGDYVEEGDKLVASINKDDTFCADWYTFFDKSEASVYVNEEITLTLKGHIGMAFSDEDKIDTPLKDISVGLWKDGVFEALEGKTTDEDGNVTLSFDKSGTYYVTADGTVSDEVTDWSTGDTTDAECPIIAPVCKILVKESPKVDEIIENIIKKYKAGGVANDGNVQWLVADFAAYEALYPEKAPVLSDEQKQAALDKIIKDVKDSVKPGDFAKTIVALRAMGYDAKNVTAADGTKLDFVGKLNTLIENKNTSVTNFYTLPYVLIALQQGEGYLSDAAKAYLIENALSQSSKWSQGGVDGATPMILALSPYYNSDQNVKSAIDNAVNDIYKAQSDSGAIKNYGKDNASSTGLAIAALSSIEKDSMTVLKNGYNLIDGLITLASDDFSGFNPTSNTFATEQGLRGLMGYKLFKSETNARVYDFIDKPLNEAKATADDESGEGDVEEGESGVGSDSITVYFTLYGDEKHGTDSEHTYKKNKSDLPVWIEKASYSVKSGATVLALFEKALKAKGLSYTNENGYISKINGLSEKDNGNLSGWMYLLNGKTSLSGVSEQKLNNGDNVIFYYTDNYTLEKGSEQFGVGTSSSSSSNTVSKKNAYSDKTVSDVSAYLQKNVENPTIGSIGGEWTILGLARSSSNISEDYFLQYYNNVKNTVISKKGILSENKYTDYARVVIALSAIGKDPENVGGYNLVTPLLDYDKVVSQGINGPIWALIALNSVNSKSEVLEKYIDFILEKQLSDGGWAISGETADPDVTAMALQALSAYKDNEKVNKAIEKAVLCLSKMQSKNGGFSSGGVENAESAAQVLTALSLLGIKYNDPDFTKNKTNILDNLMSFYINGGFKHLKTDSKANLMATEQAFYALVAMNRLNDGKCGLYDMSDVTKNENAISGLPQKNPAVKKNEIILTGKSFGDIIGHKNQNAIEKLAERGIINGKTTESYDPDSDMTRAEFAALAVRALGLSAENKTTVQFSDVTPDDWFYDFVCTAYSFGIIKGVSETEFNPYGKITRQEASVMLERSANLCGLSVSVSENEARNILSEFSDYTDAADWAFSALAFCYNSDIFSRDALEIFPAQKLTRAEIAFTLYNLLLISDLL